MLRLAMIVLTLVAMFIAPLHAAETHRIVSLNGDITEILFSLGYGDQIVAVDASSNYPEEANDKPNVGYQGRLSLEGILSFEPTIVIANPDAGPPQVIEQLQSVGVEVMILSSENTLATPVENIRAVAAVIGAEEAGEALASQVEEKIEAAQQKGSELATKPNVIFLYLGSAQMQFAGGANTSSNVMIEGAGGIDAGAAAGFVGNQVFTPESIISAQPDILIVTERGLATVGSVDKILEIPGVAQTPAAQNRKVIVFEDLYFLGMGPRSGDALMELANAFHSMQ